MEITTARLTLREMAPTDVEPLLEIFSNPKTMQFYPSPFDRAMTQSWIERNRQRYAQDGFNQLGCDQLISLIHPANWASRRVAAKNGMRLIELIQWQRKPTCLYQIERADWANYPS